MNDQSAELRELNAILDKMIRNWICIVNLDAEFCFSYDDADPDPRTSTINGYQAEADNCADFGACDIGDDGKINVMNLPNQGGKTAIISTFMRVEFPEPLMHIFRDHASQELFEHLCEFIGFDCRIDLPDVERYSVRVFLSGSVSDVRLDAFSESVFRNNASGLLTALQPYIVWFDYAASLADRFTDEDMHLSLIRNLRAICYYLDHGGQLSFAKMTSLCDVAGSLQPAWSLIRKNMPELVA